MKTISLGGLDVSRIGLGTMSMSAFYTAADGIVLTLTSSRGRTRCPRLPGERHDEAGMAGIDR